MNRTELYYASEDGHTILTCDPDLYDSYKKADRNKITIEQIADMLDSDAEDINAHDFVTIHRALAALLYKKLGRGKATEILMLLIDFGGLHGITGVCDKTYITEHEKELCVPLNNWKKWSLGA